ncbi:hypothetical protein EON66_09205 [archaeon]|nr:MAG: hypothetical protein EON66_09205 [archaeon]
MKASSLPVTRAALYHEYNERVFGSALPADLRIDWNARLTKTAGLTYSSRAVTTDELGDTSITYTARIELSKKVVDTPFKLAQVCLLQGSAPQCARALVRANYELARFRVILPTTMSHHNFVQTLLHEMCHAAAWLVDHNNKPPHGAVFMTWGTYAALVRANELLDTVWCEQSCCVLPCLFLTVRASPCSQAREQRLSAASCERMSLIRHHVQAHIQVHRVRAIVRPPFQEH